MGSFPRLGPARMIIIKVRYPAVLANWKLIYKYFTGRCVMNYVRKNFKGILIVRTDRIGDVVLSTPVIKAMREAYPDAYIAVIGDLNSFYHALPIDTLRDAGLNHVFEFDLEAGWYTYVYQGASQTLDHILVTGNLFDLVRRVAVLHVNADYAPPEVGDESPIRKSDHDPVVVVFSK